MEEQAGDEYPGKFSYLDNTSPFLPSPTGEGPGVSHKSAATSLTPTMRS